MRLWRSYHFKSWCNSATFPTSVTSTFKTFYC